MDIRGKIQFWDTLTYEQMLDALETVNQPVKNITKTVLEKLGILTRKVNGYTCENLPKTEESRLPISKTYSEMFHEEMEQENGSPLGYICRITTECINHSIDTEKIVGAVARGLRTLSSFLREPDFAVQLKDELVTFDSDVSTNLNAKQDSSDHTDVLLNFNNFDYRIWLYQFSARGLPHDIERMTGKRGELPTGIHVICPLHTEVAIEYEQLSNRICLLQERIEKTNQLLSTCSDRAIKRKQSLLERLDNYQSELRVNGQDLAIVSRKTKQELDIICGWYLYSADYIHKVAEYIVNLNQPTKYEDVLSILSGPEKFIGQINSFSKGVVQ